VGQELSVFVVLAAHANASGCCFPGDHRLATLSGISETTLPGVLKSLEAKGWIRRLRGPRNIREFEVHGDWDKALSIPKAVVFGGLWASITPSARRLYLLLQALSRLGPGTDYERLCTGEWEAAIETYDRHLLPPQLAPQDLARFAGLKERTYRDAMVCLTRWGLIACSDAHDGLLLPDPKVKSSGVLDSLQKSRGGDGSKLGTAGTKRATAWRRKRMTMQPSGNPPSSNRQDTPAQAADF